MVNWFAQQKHTFEGVTRGSRDISIPHFMLACESFIEILSVAPSNLLLPVKYRFKQDYEVILIAYLKSTDKVGGRLSQLLDMDKETNCLHRSCDHVTHKTLLLANGFDFLSILLGRVAQNPYGAPALSEVVQKAFDESIARCHTPATAKLLAAALMACPDKRLLMEKLQNGDTIEKTQADARLYIAGMEEVRDVLVRMVNEREIGLTAHRPV